MSVSLLPPDVRRLFADLTRRVGILERRISPTAAALSSGINGDEVFSYAGALVSATESPPVKLRYSGFLAAFAVALKTAGSSSTTLEVNINGSVVATVVVPSSSSDYVIEIGVRVGAEDRLSLTVATAGTDAADMTAAARFT